MENPFAFPADDEATCQFGMSLRDYFAGQAITGIMAAVIAHRVIGAVNWETEVKIAFRVADTMLQLRERTK